jgi:hydroxymethylbilane synthase
MDPPDKNLTKANQKPLPRLPLAEELDNLLQQGLVDMVVMEARELPAQTDLTSRLLAMPKRGPVGDVMLSYNKYFTLDDDSQKLVLGAPSPVKVALARHYFPKIKVIEMTGNLPTRLKKMEDGHCDALIVPVAEMQQGGYEPLVVKQLPVDQFFPAIGQGMMVVKFSGGLPADQLRQAWEAVNHPASALALLAERALAEAIGRETNLPHFAFGQLDEEGLLNLQAGMISPNGKDLVQLATTGPFEAAKDLAEDLAMGLLAARMSKTPKKQP